MRVVSGEARGRPLKSVPGKTTRPTSDKVKEAIYSRLGPYFSGGAVLDLYAGTGGLGIEALSRGMTFGVFVDMDKKAIDTIRENLQHTDFSDVAEVYRNDALRALKLLAKRELCFDLVLLDPPYRDKKMEEVIDWMQQQGLLCPAAHIVVEHDSSHIYSEVIGAVTQTRRAVYGDTAVTFYSYSSQGNERGNRT